MADETSNPATEAEGTTEAVVLNNGEATETEISYAGGKYKSVSDLEKGYDELQKTFSSKTAEYNENVGKYAQTQAPEAYELAEGVESTPRVEALMAYGKEHNLSNDALNAIIQNDAEAAQVAQEAYVTEQKDMLGKDADTRINNVRDWAIANGGEDTVLNGMLTSAKAVEFMESVMKNSQGTSPAQAPARPAMDKDSLNAMRFAKTENGDRRMSIDAAYRAKVEAAEAEFYGR